MSRLYGKITSDRRKTDATAGANETITSRFTWGSAKNPQTAVVIELMWEKGKSHPFMFVTVGSGLRVRVFAENKEVYTQVAKEL